MKNRYMKDFLLGARAGFYYALCTLLFAFIMLQIALR